jgi:hypothetical protein
MGAPILIRAKLSKCGLWVYHRGHGRISFTKTDTPLSAWELKQQGWKQGLIARALGVTPVAVSQWLKWAREEPTKKG